MKTRFAFACVSLIALCSALLGQSTREYKICVGTDNSSMERSLNQAAKAGYRFHSIVQNSTIIEVQRGDRGSDILASANRAQAVVESGSESDRYSYRVISASWPEILTSTEDEAAEHMEQQLNEKILNQLRQSAEDGFFYPRRAIYPFASIGEDDKVIPLTGIRVILEKDNLEEDGSGEYKLGEFKVLVAARAKTIEREINEASQNKFHLQSVIPILSKHHKFTGVNRIISILAYDESKSAEYRVILGTNNKKKISVPGSPNRKKTLKNLNALSAEGFRYLESLPNSHYSFMIIHERDVAAHGEMVPVDYDIVEARKSELSEMLFEASRDGYRLLGLMLSESVGIVARPSDPS